MLGGWQKNSVGCTTFEGEYILDLHRLTKRTEFKTYN